LCRVFSCQDSAEKTAAVDGDQLHARADAGFRKGHAFDGVVTLRRRRAQAEGVSGVTKWNAPMAVLAFSEGVSS